MAENREIKRLFCSREHGIHTYTKEKASTIAMGWYSLAEQQSQSCKAHFLESMATWLRVQRVVLKYRYLLI